MVGIAVEGNIEGTHAGMDGLDLEDDAENVLELRGALDTWGTDTP